MSEKTATILGASGLIGSFLLDFLQRDDYYTHVRVLSRRPLSSSNPKIDVVVLDFSDETAFKKAITGSDVVFCTVGTTLKNVKGDLVAYRKVDYDIPVNAAKFCAETGCSQFLLVTSVGANAKSSNFYIQLKGAAEEAVCSQGIPCVGILRPSMLLGKRNESRPAEYLGQVLMRAFSFLIPSIWKPIDARDVAKAMLALSKKEEPGTRYYYYQDLMQAASK